MNRTNNAYTETKNTLPRSIRFRSVGLLNRSLASAIDLERQATQAHWNVKGPNFIALHELFDKVAEATEEFSDLLKFGLFVPERGLVVCLDCLGVSGVAGSG